MYSSFTEMPVWQKSLETSKLIFEMSLNLPRSEDYGLTSQIRRAANSVSANIAEGFGRNGNKDKINFYIVARGSAFETQSHIHYGITVGYFNNNDTMPILDKYNQIIHEINKVIYNIRDKLNA